MDLTATARGVPLDAEPVGFCTLGFWRWVGVGVGVGDGACLGWLTDGDGRVDCDLFVRVVSHAVFPLPFGGLLAFGRG